MATLLNTLTATPNALQASRAAAFAGATAASAPAAALQASAWFNQPALENSRVLRAPAGPTGATAQELTANFLSCLQDEADR
jgi:hypothetical protein